MKTVDKLNDIRLFATDLDGTLLNDAGEVSEENKRALKFLQDNGVQVVAASGRIVPHAYRAAKEIGLGIEQDLNIAAGGGVVYKGKKLIHKLDTIDNEAYKKAIRLSKDRGYDIIVTDGEKVYYDTPNRFSDEYINQIFPDEPEVVNQVENLEDLEDMLKIMFHYNSEEDFIRAQDLEECGVAVFRGGPDLIEVADPKLNKWSGLEKIMQLDGLDASNVLSVGDSGNDGPMLFHSGIGVAMKNALPEVMDNSDMVNDFDNNEDGVAELIWTMFAPEKSLKNKFL